jgi:hypothetical protein
MPYRTRVKAYRLLSAPERPGRPWRFALFAVVVLVCSAGIGRPVPTLTMSAPAGTPAELGSSPAFASVAVAQAAPTASGSTTSSVDSAWTSQDWLEWEAQVPRVPAPRGISAGEPLRVEVVAVGSAGWGVPDASVEITWILPDGQFQDDCTTGLFGHAVATRTLDASCRGKRCVVAVSVTRDGKSGQAYSAFVPN